MKSYDKVPKLTAQQKKHIESLASLPDAAIDTSDIPEWTAKDFASAVRLHSLYKPRKQQITTNIDADVLLWLKNSGTLYQRRLNAILRAAMINDLQSGGQKETRRSKAKPAKTV